jgi:heat shock protein HslJ
MDADETPGDELMDARLNAAGARWRAANPGAGAGAVVADAVGELAAPRDRKAALRRRLPLIASAAVIVGVLIAGGAWFANRPGHSGGATPAGSTETSTGTGNQGLTGVTWHVYEVQAAPPNTFGGVTSITGAGFLGDFRIDSDGTVNGEDGCNHFSGRGVVTGSSIRFGDIAITAMGCLDSPTTRGAPAIDAVIQGSVDWSIQASASGHTLTLARAGVGSLSLTDAQQQIESFDPAKLVGRWGLSSYEESSGGTGGGSATGQGSSDPTGFGSYLSFDGAGHFATEERCYHTAGDVSFVGSSGTFSGVHNTMTVPCPYLPNASDRTDEQKRTQLVDDTLSGQAKLSIDGNGDLIITKNGTTLSFARLSAVPPSGSPTNSATTK